MVIRLSRRNRYEEKGRAIARGTAIGHGNRESPNKSTDGDVSHVAFWQTSLLFLLILVILIITGVIEVKMPSQGNKENQVSMGGVVQLKSRTSSSSISDSVTDNNETMEADQSPKNVEMTSPPTKVTQPEPTYAPTRASQEALKEEHRSEPPQPVTLQDLTSARKMVRHTYQRRGQPMTDQSRKEMIEKWGQWTLVDDKDRPSTDYYMAYPNRDIPRSDFPANAWQTDTEYLSKFLPEAIKLVDRAMEAILAEYGKTDGDFKERAEMFELEMVETLDTASNYIITKPEWRRDETGERGGWSTYKSLEGLQRRLLHAVMTEDTFVFALGGHSAAAGHGNMFVQSYSVQVQWIMEAIFARLGVRHQSKNFANGGLGTIQVRDIHCFVYPQNIPGDSQICCSFSMALQQILCTVLQLICLCGIRV
jgi:hypothetical protein